MKTKPHPSLSTSHCIDLGAARRAMSALLPNLPGPRISEWMTVRGIRLPPYEALGVANSPPILIVPGALLEQLGPYSIASLPQNWIPAHEQNRGRWGRTTQLLRLHSACLRAESGDGELPEVADCDEVVAGLLLLLVQPRLGKMREALAQAATVVPGSFGAYLMTHGMMVEDEHARVLKSLGSNSLLASTLCRRDPEAACDLPQRLLAVSDVWSAAVALHHADAQQWLQRTVNKAAVDPAAAVTALALQPRAAEGVRDQWITVLLKEDPICSYEAARWTKCTWDPARWGKLCDRLRERATSDNGRACCFWYRDLEQEKSDEALQDDALDVLWAAELISSTENFGQGLRRRMALRLKASPADVEAKLTLRWLNLRNPPR